MTDDQAVRRADRPHRPWRGPAATTMRVKQSRRPWSGTAPQGRGSDVAALIAPERGAKKARRHRNG